MWKLLTLQIVDKNHFYLKHCTVQNILLYCTVEGSNLTESKSKFLNFKLFSKL